MEERPVEDEAGSDELVDEDELDEDDEEDDEEDEDEPRAPAPKRAGGRGAAFVLALAGLGWAALFGFSLWRRALPEPLAATADAKAFSAHRALGFLEAVLGDAGPHPSGSAANAAVRARLVSAFEELGFEAEVWTADVEGRFVGPLHDVVARLDGDSSGPALMLAAHYDSVAAGPGAADDLAGVAALLEVARALRAAGTPRNPVVFLVTDGEEDDLLGARTFAREHPWMAEVACVVNVEARGNSGQSTLFETGPDNAWLIDVYAANAPLPSATSISYEVYRRMPNDTDFTVFQQHGKTGVNFAFIGGWRDYHTANDSLERLHLGSLQHQGDNLLAMAAGLSRANLAHPPPGDAVYTDLWNYTLVAVPARWALAAGILAVVLVGFCVLRGVLGPRVDGAGVIAGVVAAAVCSVVPGFAGYAVVSSLRALRGIEQPWWANPLPTLISLVAATLAVSFFLASLFARGKGKPRLGYGTAILWAAAGLWLGVRVPGASYLFLVPALLAGLLFLVLPPERGERNAAWGLVPMLVLWGAAALWSPVSLGLIDAFGPGPWSGLAITMPFALLAGWLAPLFHHLAPACHRAAHGIAWLTALGSWAVALAVVDHDAEHPAHVNLHYVFDANAGSATWHVHARGIPLPAALAEVATFAEPAGELVPCDDHEPRGLVAPAPLIDGAGELERPRFEIAELIAGKAYRIVRGRVFPGAGAYRTLIAVRGAGGAAMGSVVGRDAPWSGAGWRVFLAPPAEGFELELAVGAGAGAPELVPELVIVDVHLGLPEQAAALVAARDAEGVPYRWGDLSLVVARTALE